MLFRKHRIPREPSPPWLKWALVAFVAFAALSSRTKGTPDHPNPVHDAFEQAADHLKPGQFIDLKAYKDKLFPAYNAAMRIRDTAPGEGRPAVCGQEVRIAYDAFHENGDKLADSAGSDHPLVFRIGESAVMPALEQGVVGMKPGGARSVFSPPAMAYGAKESSSPVRFEITLLSATPALPDLDAAPFRIAETRLSNGLPITCGRPAKIRLTLWSLDGKKLDAGDQPISFTPGRSQMPVGLEQGVIGMSVGGARTLIIPPSFQKTLRGNAAAIDFPFPKGQTVLVDVEGVN